MTVPWLTQRSLIAALAFLVLGLGLAVAHLQVQNERLRLALDTARADNSIIRNSAHVLRTELEGRTELMPMPRRTVAKTPVPTRRMPSTVD